MSRAGRKLMASPEYVIGSVHAITHQGQVLIASGTGSQLAGYAFGASHVIWVVGAQKIVRNVDEGLRRIWEYSYPLENERMQTRYGVSSFPAKILLAEGERHHPESWLFRTFRAMEAILENALLSNRLGEPIQHQCFFDMEEVSTESAEESESCVTTWLLNGENGKRYYRHSMVLCTQNNPSQTGGNKHACIQEKAYHIEH